MLRLRATFGVLFLIASVTWAADPTTADDSAAAVPAFMPMPRRTGADAASKIVMPRTGEASSAGNPISSAISAAANPFKKMLSWGTSLLSKSEAKVEPAAVHLQTPLKIRSIQYLAEMDDQSYPQVVDSLLASLDDPLEEVRYEALRAITEKCKNYRCEYTSDTTFVRAQQCDCPGCRADPKVVHRLNGLLLDRGADGGLREQSARNRDLAMAAILTCLERERGSRPASISPQTASTEANLPELAPLPLGDDAQ